VAPARHVHALRRGVGERRNQCGTLGINDVLDGFRFSGGTNVSVVNSLAGAAAKTYLGSSTNAATLA